MHIVVTLLLLHELLHIAMFPDLKKFQIQCLGKLKHMQLTEIWNGRFVAVVIIRGSCHRDGVLFLDIYTSEGLQVYAVKYH